MGRFSSTVEDSLCIGQRRPKDLNERVLLFVKMRPGNSLSSALIKDIRSSIRASLSPRHVPAYIFEVDDIPYTVNGKKVLFDSVDIPDLKSNGRGHLLD